MRAVPALLALAFNLAALPSFGVEANARLGVSSPMNSNVGLGPSAGLTLGIPLRARIQLVAAGDFSTHAIQGSARGRIDAITAAFGLEVGLDLAPIVPTIGLGPSYQYAHRRDTDATSGSFGGYLAVGCRATVFDHLRLGFQARYLTAAFASDGFPAFATFVLELGWTS